MSEASLCVTRRGFVAGVASAAAVGTLGVRSIASAEAPDQWDETYDVVVVGAGAAGYMAAYAAFKAGSSVVLIEKTGATGGDTILSEQRLTVVLPDEFLDQIGQQDSPELYVEEVRKTFPYSAMGMAGLEQPADNPFLLRQAELGPQWAEFGMNEVGLQMSPQAGVIGSTTGPIPPAETVTRYIIPATDDPTAPASGNFIMMLRELSEADGLPVITDMQATKVYRDDSGRAVGIAAYDYKTDSVRYFGASKAVVLTTGSICGNSGMLESYLGIGQAQHGGSAGNTGDGIAMALDAGVALRSMDLGSHWLSFSRPADTKTLTYLEFYSRDEDGNATAIPGIVVNYDAQRFVAESLGYSRVSEAMYDQPYHEGFLVCESSALDVLGAQTGMPFVADSIDELAAAMQVDSEALSATVERFNGFVEAGVDDDFDAYMFGATQILNPPFAAVRLCPRVYYTYGGIAVDVDGHALDEDGQIIPGLYAAGSVCGSFAEQEGVFYQGGLGQAFCFGMQAGRNAAAEEAL
jgi:succinate dehydrogenase/fumarate reductase flavoprotein subunit